MSLGGSENTVQLLAPGQQARDQARDQDCTYIRRFLARPLDGTLVQNNSKKQKYY